MADQANNFGPLTPEQEAALRKDKINESMGPLDGVVPTKALLALLGAGIGAGGTLASGIPGLMSIPAGMATSIAGKGYLPGAAAAHAIPMAAGAGYGGYKGWNAIDDMNRRLTDYGEQPQDLKARIARQLMQK